MKKFLLILIGMVLLTAAVPALAEVVRTEANNGNLVMEDIPEIPESIVTGLNRYQNSRSAGFYSWNEGGDKIYISTRFGDVSQIHRVDHPGGARHQITFFKEPVGSLARQPQGPNLAFTMDAGGSEFAQIFLFDPTGTAEAVMLTDGESRNTQVVWDRAGRNIAFQSTRRNGSSNDIWLMDVTAPDEARMVWESPDGTAWAPVDFSADGTRLLVINYVGNADSRIHLLDFDAGTTRMVAGDPANPSSNFPVAFDHDGAGFWLITDVGGDFQQLAWQSFAEGAEPVILTADIPWAVEGGTVNAERTRGAFTVNEDGLSRLYLLDMVNREFKPVAGIPTGLIGGMEFSPDSGRLALTINTPKTPSDSFVLELGQGALDSGELVRWTYSEVGGLDTSKFIEPELVHYPTFDTGEGGPDAIPAWVYKPAGGKGPYPVIISIHGGPESQARPSFRSTTQYLLNDLGAAIVVPNVRGSSGYGKHYLSLDNGFKREDSVKDIGALLDWIETQPDLDQDRVAVIGGSYGGYMVLASAVYYSDRLRGAIDIVGISNFVTFLENTQDYRRDLRRVEYGDERDPEMRAHLEKISPLNMIDRIKVPLLVVQGENDPRVPVTEAIQVVEALRAQGQPVWYMNALNEGHGYRKKENRDIYQQATVLFFREFLLGQ